MRRVYSAFLILLLSSSLQAAPVYSLRFGSTSLSANPGQSVTLDVFFDEDATMGPPLLDLAGGTNGLIIANFGVNVSGTGTSTVTAANGNASFDDIVFDAVPPATLAQSTIVNDPVFGSGTGTIRSVLLGTITVTANGNVGDQNLLSLADFSPGADFVIDDGFGTLSFVAEDSPGFSYGTATINVTAVPEPSSFALLGLVGAVGAYRLRRRRERSQSAAL